MSARRCPRSERCTVCPGGGAPGEGGANAVGEAIVAGVPPMVTAIAGSLGLLGVDWPATFPVGDARALADLILRVERDATFTADLRRRLCALAPRFHRRHEIASWRALLAQWAPQCLPAEVPEAPR